MKPGSLQIPTGYLRADISLYTIHDEDQDIPIKQASAMSAQEYFKHTIQEVERELAQHDAYLPKQGETPLSHDFCP